MSSVNVYSHIRFLLMIDSEIPIACVFLKQFSNFQIYCRHFDSIAEDFPLTTSGLIPTDSHLESPILAESAVRDVRAGNLSVILRYIHALRQFPAKPEKILAGAATGCGSLLKCY